MGGTSTLERFPISDCHGIRAKEKNFMTSLSCYDNYDINITLVTFGSLSNTAVSKVFR